MEFVEKEVYFHEYCNKCKYRNAPEYEDPCHECLHHAMNANSHKPVRYEKEEQ